MAPVPVARAVRLPITAIMTALALSGCMRTTASVAVAQPPSDLDSLAYGQPYDPAPVVSSPSSVADSGGAISALRNSFAAAPRREYAPVPVAYAAAPMPPAHDAAYRLDARDKLRVGGYGQGGLPHTYSIHARGAVTIPPVRSCPAGGPKP